MSTKAFNISLPEELVKKLDKIAKRDYTSRSDVIRRAVLREIRQPLDEWGDPVGYWEEGVDLRDIDKNGVPIEDVLASLERLRLKDEQNRQTAKKA